MKFVVVTYEQTNDTRFIKSHIVDSLAQKLGSLDWQWVEKVEVFPIVDIIDKAIPANESPDVPSEFSSEFQDLVDKVVKSPIVTDVTKKLQCFAKTLKNKIFV